MKQAMTAEEIKSLLKLEPHPIEGGWYRRTYTSAGTVELDRGVRAVGTAIYYLLEEGTFSEMHKVAADEIFHFYLGDPVEMLQVAPDGSGQTILLGQEIEAGMRLQHNVPGNHWQGSRLVAGGRFALLGTTMSPGFDYVDYVTGRHAELCAQFPRFAEMITQLTR